MGPNLVNLWFSHRAEPFDEGGILIFIIYILPESQLTFCFLSRFFGKFEEVENVSRLKLRFSLTNATVFELNKDLEDSIDFRLTRRHPRDENASVLGAAGRPGGKS